MKQIYTFRSATKEEQNFVGYYKKLTDGQENLGTLVSPDETSNFCPFKLSTLCKNLHEQLIYDLRNGFSVEVHINDITKNIEPVKVLETPQDIMDVFFKDNNNKPVLTFYLADKLRRAKVDYGNYVEAGKKGGLKVTDGHIKQIDEVIELIKEAAK